MQRPRCDFVGDGVPYVLSARQRSAGNGLPRQSADWLAMTRCVGDGVPDVPSARRCRAGKRIAAPVCGLARNDKVCRGRRPRRPVSAALPRCHSEPVTVSLAWESVLSFVGKRIAAPVCTPRALASRRGLARNDKVCRGRRPAVERSGTNALGVRRPISAAAPRCHSEPVTVSLAWESVSP